MPATRASVEAGRRNRAEIVEFIDTYTRDHCKPPTRREISAGVGLSVGAVADHLKILLKQGTIANDGGQRGLRIVDIINGETR